MSELKAIIAAMEKLRADLIATNMAMQCVMTSMPPEAQQQTLKALAQLSVMQEQSAASQQNPETQAAMQLVQQAVQRQYQGLQGAHKLRMSKLQKDSEAP